MSRATCLLLLIAGCAALAAAAIDVIVETKPEEQHKHHEREHHYGKHSYKSDDGYVGKDKDSDSDDSDSDSDDDDRKPYVQYEKHDHNNHRSNYRDSKKSDSDDDSEHSREWPQRRGRNDGSKNSDEGGKSNLRPERPRLNNNLNDDLVVPGVAINPEQAPIAPPSVIPTPAPTPVPLPVSAPPPPTTSTAAPIQQASLDLVRPNFDGLDKDQAPPSFPGDGKQSGEKGKPGRFSHSKQNGHDSDSDDSSDGNDRSSHSGEYGVDKKHGYSQKSSESFEVHDNAVRYWVKRHSYPHNGHHDNYGGKKYDGERYDYDRNRGEGYRYPHREACTVCGDFPRLDCSKAAPGTLCGLPNVIWVNGTRGCREAILECYAPWNSQQPLQLLGTPTTYIGRGIQYVGRHLVCDETSQWRFRAPTTGERTTVTAVSCQFETE